MSISPNALLHPALNAMTLDFSIAHLRALQQCYTASIAPLFQQVEYARKLEGVYYHNETLPGGDFDLISYDTYPLLWLTNRTANSYQLFQDFFQHLPLKEALRSLVKKPPPLQLYSGFFVLGNQASEPLWHYDYRTGARAYTLITPLFPWQAQHGHLLYQDPQHNTHTYTYHQGQGIVLGDGFLHSTAPYEPSTELRVLVSLTFGSKHWRDWALIARNIGEQSYFYRLPCGHASTQNCRCYSRWQFWQRLLGKR